MKMILLLAAMMATFGQAATVKTGDVLAISIKGVPTEEEGRITSEYPVSGDGKIHMPFISSIDASGITTSALARRIETAYKTAKIYTTPTISIQSLSDAKRKAKQIEEDIQKYLTVSGQVGRPGPQPYRPGLKLIDVVSQAGPSVFAAQNRVELLRGGEIYKFNMKVPAHMLFVVQPNDQITLKEKNPWGN